MILFFNSLSSHRCFAYLAAYLLFRKFFCQASYHQTRGCISQLCLGSGNRMYQDAVGEGDPCLPSSHANPFLLILLSFKIGVFPVSSLGWSVVSLVHGS